MILSGPYCGDNMIQGDAGEICDDSTRGQTNCPYGMASCTLCGVDCKSRINAVGPYCGDGIVNGGGGVSEACDDGNTSSCGTCSLNCQQDQLAAATGSITTVSGVNLKNGETFTLNDGPILKTFDFVKSGGGVPGLIHIPVADTENAATVAGKIVNQITNAGLRISASIGCAPASPDPLCLISLENTRLGSQGNRNIIESVADPAFTTTGMGGGGGYDCPVNTGCTLNADCNASLGLTCKNNPRTCR
jgi:cysteine-rich repeat protein